MNFKKTLFAVTVLALALLGIYFFVGGTEVEDSGGVNVLGVEGESLFEVYGDLLVAGGEAEVALDGSYKELWLKDRVNFENVLGFWEGPYAGFDGFEEFVGEQSAFVLEDVGTKYPAAVFYLDVSSDIGAGRDLMEFLGEFVRGFLVGFGFSDESLIDDVVVVKGFGMKRLKIDWNLSGEAVLVLGAAGLNDLMGEKAELYYGISDDGVLVLALYPGFEDAYGEGGVFDVDGDVFVFARAKELYESLIGLNAWNFLSEYSRGVLESLKGKFEVKLRGDYDEIVNVLRVKVY